MTTYKLGFLGVVLCLFNQSFLYQVILYLFFVGRVKQQRNPTHLLGYGYGSHVATQAIATVLRFYGSGSIPNSRNLAASLSAL